MALQKIKHYCGYQERCHAEVKDKLYRFGLYPHEVDALMAQIIEEGFLNEERFALAFAGGKFRIKHWGRQRITQALKLKKVSPYCIKAALAAIDPADYEKTFLKLAQTKWEQLKVEKNKYTKKQKLRQFLQYKGFETKLITRYLDAIET